jgi:pimeloyl-ACP methyl ester carboxylesterase
MNPASEFNFADMDISMSTLRDYFPEYSVETADGILTYRGCGRGQTVVLLHGIGSGAASWLACALSLAKSARVIAWNAPGYGDSTALPMESPQASDYAARLEQLLSALGIADCVLIGHSLGAITACAYIAAYKRRVSRLVLLDPAQGYGSEELKIRGQEVEEQRLAVLASLGIQGMAQTRSSHMLSPQASNGQRSWVQWNMSLLNHAGYKQAVRMLCGDDIHNYAPIDIPGAIYCGTEDTITSPASCESLASQLGLPYGQIDHAGHASYVEQPAAVAAAISETSLFIR